MRNLKMKFRRIELEMSQTDLAKACGVTRQTIGLIEAGEIILAGLLAACGRNDHTGDSFQR